MDSRKVKGPTLLFLGLALFLSGCSHLLYYPSRSHLVPSRKLAEMKIEHQNIHFETEDHVRLHGWYFPSKKTQKPKAILVFFHGNAENISTHFASLAWIVDYEYDLFIFDYRGYGHSDGTPSPKGTIEDGKAAVKWAQNHSPGTPIVLFGQSLGGAIAIRTAAELKDDERIRAVIVDSTFASYQEAGASLLSRSAITWPFQWLAYLLLSDRYAPVGHLADLGGKPLLVMHGDHDTKVSFKLGEKLYESASAPKEFWRIPDGYHIDSFWRHDGEYRNRFVEYLNNLGVQGRLSRSSVR